MPAGAACPCVKYAMQPREIVGLKRQLKRVDRQRPYDVVHANFFLSALVASDLRRTFGTPYVVTFHALGRVRRLHQGAADRFPDERLEIEDAVVGEADQIIAECPQDADDLVELYEADRRRQLLHRGYARTDQFRQHGRRGRR